MIMKNASRDGNRVPTIQGVSAVDKVTPTDILVNPATGEVLVAVAPTDPVTPVSVFNPETTLEYTDDLLTSITKTFEGVEYVKTISYTDGNPTSISAWEVVE